MNTTGRIFLIDGSAQIYRAYHAIRELTGPSGKSTNAVYGFVTMLKKLISDHQPELIAAAFDLPGPTFRHEIAEDYKANRPPMPLDLAEQISWVHEACEALGVQVLTSERYEADDIIGTLATCAATEGLKVVIVTSDKDFFQLVDNKISIFNPRDQGIWYDADGVKEKFGVEPQQVVDVLSLMGDAIDNVKGVPGIGEKGARELIASYGSLDTLLDHVEDIKKKKHRSALLTHADDARQSRELVRIRSNVPVPFEPDKLRYSGPNQERCFSLFSMLGFRSLLAEYAPTANTVTTNYSIVQSAQELKTLIKKIRSSGRCALRVIANQSDITRNMISGIALATGPRQASYIPIDHRTLQDNTELKPIVALEMLSPLLADSTVLKMGHNLKFDAMVLSDYDIELVGLDIDTMVVSYLLDATRATHRLDELALEHCGYKTIVLENILGRGAKAQNFSDLPTEAIVDYACEQSDLIFQLATILKQLLTQKGLETLYRTLELPLIPVLTAIELAGIRIDIKALATLSQYIEGELTTLQSDIHKMSGVVFNINSPKQLSEVLFGKLQLPTTKRTGKTRAASTSIQVLEELAQVHELPRKIIEWRSLKKLKGTYVDALPKLVNPKTDRLHTSFNQTVATTGRLSSSEPNLQNIPIRTEIGKTIRGTFVANSGSVLISADYSQIELRVLAHLSKDKNLIKAFNSGDDIHDQTAQKVFGQDSGLERHELRRRAKMINYALLYGKTAFTLAKDIGVTQQSAQKFIDSYFDGFPAVRNYLEKTIAHARETGVVNTLFGRQRRVPELTSRNGQIRAAAERVAVNMPIQGTAADILKKAMIDIYKELPVQAAMILTVHDELLFEVSKTHVNTVTEFVRKRMEQVVSLAVPLIVDIGIGKNWKDAKA